MPEDAEPAIHPECAYFYGRLRQVLITYTSASALLAARWLGRKRRAILHLDHLFSDWRYMVDMRGCYKFKHIVRLMGEDMQTEWELRYYVYIGCSERENSHWSNCDEQLAEEMDSIVGVCEQYANIKVVAEVYGKLKWSLEDRKKDVTRVITSGSALWPSWLDSRTVNLGI